ncbi:hypothetical protein HYZ70_02075 [Candidatus Curtissbacteria bacterium]|nr:hypothetical protein [Candidatus Curtissbacteria bacterium]
MINNRIIQRLIFDSILVAIFFLPLFAMLFLWNIFFQPRGAELPSAPQVPKFDETTFTVLRDKVLKRKNFAKPKPFSETIYGSTDPFSL